MAVSFSVMVARRGRAAEGSQIQGTRSSARSVAAESSVVAVPYTTSLELRLHFLPLTRVAKNRAGH
jgi:hypothetical protein